MDGWGWGGNNGCQSGTHFLLKLMRERQKSERGLNTNHSWRQSVNSISNRNAFFPPRTFSGGFSRIFIYLFFFFFGLFFYNYILKIYILWGISDSTDLLVCFLPPQLNSTRLFPLLHRGTITNVNPPPWINNNRPVIEHNGAGNPTRFTLHSTWHF